MLRIRTNRRTLRSTPTGVPENRTLTWILFGFAGRIPRRVFWGAWLASAAVSWAIVFALAAVFGQKSGIGAGEMLVLQVLLIWISLAIQIKRWHDRDKSGWWVLINLIPLIGAIWAFVETGCLRGTIGPNAYGADPT